MNATRIIRTCGPEYERSKNHKSQIVFSNNTAVGADDPDDLLPTKSGAAAGLQKKKTWRYCNFYTVHYAHTRLRKPHILPGKGMAVLEVEFLYVDIMRRFGSTYVGGCGRAERLAGIRAFRGKQNKTKRARHAGLVLTHDGPVRSDKQRKQQQQR